MCLKEQSMYRVLKWDWNYYCFFSSKIDFGKKNKPIWFITNLYNELIISFGVMGPNPFILFKCLYHDWFHIQTIKIFIHVSYMYDIYQKRTNRFTGCYLMTKLKLETCLMNSRLITSFYKKDLVQLTAVDIIDSMPWWQK